MAAPTPSKFQSSSTSSSLQNLSAAAPSAGLSSIPSTVVTSTAPKPDGTANPKVRNLWQEAQEQLSDRQRDILNISKNDEQLKLPDLSDDILETVIKRTEEEYKNYNLRGWHSKKGDKTRETNVRIQAKEILCSALEFKSFVDSGMKFDPSGYGVIVWTVVSGGLQLLQNDKDRLEAVFDSSAVLSRLLPKYAIVESQYLDWKTDKQKTFEDLIIEVYAALLRYAAEVSIELGIKTGSKYIKFWLIAI